MESSALPEANRVSCPDRHLVWNRPRNACDWHTLRGHWPGKACRLRPAAGESGFYRVKRPVCMV